MASAMNPSAVPATAEKDASCHLVADDVVAQANVQELEPATTMDGERDHQDCDSGHNEVEQDCDNGGGGGSDGDEEDEDYWYRDLMERFRIACRIVDLRFDIKEFIDTYFNPSQDPELQREAMRRMREEVERKQQQEEAAQSGEDDLLLGGAADDADGSGGASAADDLDEQMEKFLRACGFADRMSEVQRIIDTYFDEDLDDEACQAAIDQLWGKLDKELQARSNAVSTGKFRL